MAEETLNNEIARFRQKYADEIAGLSIGQLLEIES
jgi:hypothetical protein